MLDARADYHLNVPTGGQPLSALVTLTAPTYLSKGEIHLSPLDCPVLSTTVCFTLMLRRRRREIVETRLHFYTSYSLLIFFAVIPQRWLSIGASRLKD
jgi:hypothetical protein